MSDLSRRSVAKGAAWSIPAISVVGAAPSLAASKPVVTYPSCVDPAGMGNTTGLKSWAAASGTKKADTATYGGSSDIGMGTMLSVNMGQFQFIQPPFSGGKASGYKMLIGDTAVVRTAAGKTGTATIGAKGDTSVMVIGAGIQQNITIQTTVPYKLVAKKAANYVTSLSIPFCITYLDNLTPIVNTATGQTACCYYINFCYPAKPDVFGNYPDSGNVGNSGNQYVFSLAPVDPCA